MERVAVTVNGRSYSRSVPPRMLLVHFLREELGLTGTHAGCVVGRCGACTVVWDGRPVKSCMVLAAQVDGSGITTIEGLADGDRLHPIQQAFCDCDASECGFCTPGMIMSLYALLSVRPAATAAEVRESIGGNLCRCTGYVNILRAAERAQALLSGKGGEPGAAG